MSISTIVWKKDHVRLIDQTKLPHELVYLDCYDVEPLCDAIKRLSVRGAPALGVAAGFGVLLGIKDFTGHDRHLFNAHIEQVCAQIGASRPTAVNLFYALDRMQMVVEKHPHEDVPAVCRLLEKEAMAMFKEDQQVCRQMGNFGAKLIRKGGTYITVCNAGALATSDYGTALGVFYSAQAEGKDFKVFSLETRPLLQGARLTVWELMQSKIDVTLICDNMAASVMKNQKIDGIFAGADRIASNGDAANKIGTYMLAVLAKYHKVPFYIVAPESTFDLSIKSGEQIPIEQRGADEVRSFGGCKTAPDKVKVFNPAFDVTDHGLIKGIVTEKGIITPPFKTNIKRAFLNG
ncbi:MAG: S-methyl-5-thioribose-1-phosphate isomerase [Candidatus Omnitrophica bacterium]|nr:S-methyl-5-thioribose-1-phosphate isomerase [Candidatus Omnitrophota bacterium]